MSKPLQSIDVFPPHGYIQLTSHAGGDLSVVNAAKASFAKEVSEVGKAEEKLILFLMRNKHGTPFEHNSFTFRVRAPLFVVREWQRHRIGVSYNEESGRYTELRADFFKPLGARSQVGKPGAYTFELKPELDNFVNSNVQYVTKVAWDSYQTMLEKGIAKEQARIVLPLCLYSEFYFTCNARSLMNFISLRSTLDAMEEIRCYSYALQRFFQENMPITAKAFLESGCIAP